MKISAFNGSPRGVKSNSNVILNWILEGAQLNTKSSVIKDIIKNNSPCTELIESDGAVIVFPLYTDAMPGVVMKFFENISKYKDKLVGKKILYVIHSGFEEGIHSFALRDYLVQLSSKLGLIHYDVIIMGGSEGTRLMPPSWLKKKRKMFNRIGAAFAQNTPVSQDIKETLQSPVKFSKKDLMRLKLLSSTGVSNAYWNRQLKKNGVFDQRFDAPFAKK